MASTTQKPATAHDDQPLIPPPTQKAKPRLVVGMALAQMGIFVALLTPIVAGLTIKVQSLVGPDDAVTSLGIVSSAGAIAALIANPVFGRISDRTTSRYGRRRPWLVIGSLGLTASLLLIATAQSVAVVAIGFFIASVFANAALATFTATVADQIPMSQRGKIGGLMGVMQNVAILGSAYSAKFFATQLLLLFMVPGLVGLLLVGVFVMVLPDKRLPRRPSSEGGLRTVLRTFWVAHAGTPDFALVWVSRFLIVLGAALFTTFRLLYLQRDLALSHSEAAAAMATGVLLYTCVLVVSAQAAGWLSDKVGRRKPFIAGATLIFSAGLAMLVQADSVNGFYIAELVLGLEYGVYVGVDLALVIDVLPSPDNASKDLGVFNIANAGPQVIAPGLGALLVNIGGGHNYGLLQGTAAAVCLVGLLAVIPLKAR
ncbi:MFS transporter OS=Streptomyces alboniger OX=132473 GN=CP975_11420 PE=4 SV=1 [Streptomyces alboniger]